MPGLALYLKVQVEVTAHLEEEVKANRGFEIAEWATAMLVALERWPGVSGATGHSCFRAPGGTLANLSLSLSDKWTNFNLNSLLGTFTFSPWANWSYHYLLQLPSCHLKVFEKKIVIMRYCLFFLIKFFFQTWLLCRSPGCPGTCSIYQTVLQLIQIRLPADTVLWDHLSL